MTELALLCLACPVRRSCLAAALLGDEVGLWAGTTEARRGDALAELNVGGKADAVLDRLLADEATTMRGAA